MFKSTKIYCSFFLPIAALVSTATTIDAQDYYTGVSNTNPSTNSSAAAIVQPLNEPATNNNPTNSTRLVPVNEPRVVARTELETTDSDLNFDIGNIDSSKVMGQNSIASTVIPAVTNEQIQKNSLTESTAGSQLSQIDASETVIDPLQQSLGSPDSSQSALRPFVPANWKNNPMTAAIASIAIVLALFFVFKLFSRKVQKGNNQHLPSEIIQVVGWSKLNSRQNLQLVRFGTKLVLIAVAQNSAEPIAEVTDPIEVEEILAACQNNGGLSRAIRRLANGRNQSTRNAAGYPPAGTVFEA